MNVLLRIISVAFVAAVCAASAVAQTAPAGLRAARALARGDTISATDVIADSGSTADPATVIGLVARRVIREGELLRAPAVGVPVVIRAGAIVTVWAVAGGVSVSREGVALHDAGKGETVRVRLSSRTTLAGIVRDPANVVLP